MSVRTANMNMTEGYGTGRQLHVTKKQKKRNKMTRKRNKNQSYQNIP